ncbi:hypothetical protein LPB138_11760 [Urechidicola croceus]|uniref:Thioredoxin domain-containing protein n=2 Tax=Urechidicola croceus TaxID=1850246 RepID=A0A1D8P9Q0_9FLAO|nr:hypothetical protein LPB138_11760 [Urechidicola croceus]
MNAQDTIRVKLDPDNGYKRLMMYKIIGAKQRYISFAEMDEGKFNLIVPKDSGKGIYRLFFDVNNNGYFDFIYNNEPVSMSFNPSSPEYSAQFEESDENKIYQSYLNSSELLQAKIDSVQIAYFTSKEKETLEKKYKERVQNLSDLQSYFEKESEGKMANSFVKANKKYNNLDLFATPQEYLEVLDSHFFDYVDFENKDLMNSSLLVDKVMEYVFYLNDSDDPDLHLKLRQESVNNAMAKIGGNNYIKSEILSSLLYAFAGQEELKMVNYIKEGYYNQLPDEFKDAKFISTINGMMKTATGNNAPEITWKDGNKTMKLSELDSANQYLITFWSTTCSHCLNDIPKLYEFTKDLEGVKVIAIALEEDKFGFEYHTQDLPNWINVLAMNKWENEIAQSYDIHATPSYFILDKDKVIIAKPEDLEDVEAYFTIE